LYHYLSVVQISRFLETGTLKKEAHTTVGHVFSPAPLSDPSKASCDRVVDRTKGAPPPRGSESQSSFTQRQAIITLSKCGGGVELGLEQEIWAKKIFREPVTNILRGKDIHSDLPGSEAGENRRDFRGSHGERVAGESFLHMKPLAGPGIFQVRVT
jgi:hypothetical protein